MLKINSRTKEILLLAIAICMIIEIDFIGRLLLSEVLTTISLMLFFNYKKWLSNNDFTILIGLSAFWFLGAVISDIYAGSTVIDWTRGLSKVMFILINTLAIFTLLNGKIERAVIMCMSLFVVSGIRLYLSIGDEGFGRDIFGVSWKFGYGQLFTSTTLLLIVVVYRNWAIRVAYSILPLMASLANIVFGARNLFLLSLLSASISGALSILRKPPSVKFMFLLLASLFVTSFGAYKIYSYSADSGLLGQSAKDKYQEQSAGKYGLLVGGRKETIVSVQAIKDSPFIGHGSWAHDRHYADMLITTQREMGYETNDTNRGPDLIPTHSILLGSWVEHGIAGGIFWFWAIFLTAKGVYVAIKWPTRWTGFIVFVALSLIWDILYSPLGLDRRLVVPAWLCLMMVTAENGKLLHFHEKQLGLMPGSIVRKRKLIGDPR